MATYTLISSTTLTGTQATVTFSSIPATYTDLVIRASIRSDRGAANEVLYVSFNGTGGTSNSYTVLQTNSGSPQSYNGANTDGIAVNVNASTTTSNTFTSFEQYIPSYTVSQSKPTSIFSATENNAATPNWIATVAGLWRNNSAITSVVLTPLLGSNWVTGSSFYLYGISNA